MPRVRLLHLRPLEAVERIAALHALGYDVLFDPLDDRESMKRVWQTPPDAYVFDITRVPSHMRELAISLRERKTTRRVPMVFAGGDPAKVASLREVLPDATYTAWEAVGDALVEAIAHPPEAPVVPESLFAGYSGTPLPKKLGIKPGMTVALLHAPEDVRGDAGAAAGRGGAGVGRLGDEPARRVVSPVMRGARGGAGAGNRGNRRARRALDGLAQTGVGGGDGPDATGGAGSGTRRGAGRLQGRGDRQHLERAALHAAEARLTGTVTIPTCTRMHSA